ncbi:MAG TPA: CPBP family intramembrane glutamic endopeptidase [Candidatus Dormibacteraeota bacterium]|nr:CPBP family intramembrane glutamic endopeptidase [Candidatus Dormibacteraeota bacterium]
MYPLASMRSSIRRYPAIAYFLLTFFVSWLGAFLLVTPRLLHHEPIPKFTGLMMFPVMLLGPSFSGIFLAWLFDGRAGLRNLFERMGLWKLPARYYTAFLIPPIFVVSVLFCLENLVSPAFAPNHFFPGAGFGVVAGFFEEIGWMGFAFPKMTAGRKSWLPPAILLGILWGCWHIPVIDYLGAATPHGSAWLPFFLAFTAAMTAIRALICWLYTRTQSVLLAQLLHAFSTASLVVFSPATVKPLQEAFWYFLYAATLWLLIFVFAISRRISTFVSSSGAATE